MGSRVERTCKAADLDGEVGLAQQETKDSIPLAGGGEGGGINGRKKLGL